ncbi:MAG: hypothetical protein JNG85_14980, partial [Spirochaetaceae bacterium]|nr:hypothetical protein [Spirochaetaceae bacterium]
RIGMQATSVLLRKGHRIRVAVAGHDASSFARIPAEGEVEIEVLRSAAFPSRVELPVKERGRSRRPAPVPAARGGCGGGKNKRPAAPRRPASRPVRREWPDSARRGGGRRRRLRRRGDRLQ